MTISVIKKTRLTVSSLLMAVIMMSGGVFMVMLSGCDAARQDVYRSDEADINEAHSRNVTSAQDQDNLDSGSHTTQEALKEMLATDELRDGSSTQSPATTRPASTRDKPIDIDWQMIDSKVEAIDPATFTYPFAQDSNPVVSYAQFFNLSAQEAQHSLTIGTASNEPLDRLLTQLGDSYLSHELVDGKNMRLIVHTTPNVKASTYNYVIANEFARGLILPIVIQPDGKTTD